MVQARIAATSTRVRDATLPSGRARASVPVVHKGRNHRSVEAAREMSKVLVLSSFPLQAKAALPCLTGLDHYWHVRGLPCGLVARKFMELGLIVLVSQQPYF